MKYTTRELVTLAVFGALWGLGGLTFGLTMRYLGMSLGMAVALGYTAVVAWLGLVPALVLGYILLVSFPAPKRLSALETKPTYCPLALM